MPLIGMKTMLPDADMHGYGALRPGGLMRRRGMFGPMGPGRLRGGMMRPGIPSVRSPTIGARLAPSVSSVAPSVSPMVPPSLSSAYRRAPGAPWRRRRQYVQAYPSAQSYAPSYQAQSYQPIPTSVPRTFAVGRRARGRGLRRLRRLLMKARSKGMRLWRVRGGRRGRRRWVSRVSRFPYPRQKSRLTKRISRLRRRLRKRGKGRQVKMLVRQIMGEPQRVSRREAKSGAFRRGGGQSFQSHRRGMSGFGYSDGGYWSGGLGNVGIGPGMF